MDGLWLDCVSIHGLFELSMSYCPFYTLAVLCMENHVMRRPPGTRQDVVEDMSPFWKFPIRFPGSERKPEKETRQAEKGGRENEGNDKVKALVWARACMQLQKTVTAKPRVAMQ